MNIFGCATHETHGHPSAYRFDALANEVGDNADREYVEQCGSGGVS